jgi:pimeloyl-ACP methyl ester carboxylesterase
MQAFEVQSGKARLTGLRAGSGSAVLFLHAGVCDKRMWQDQMAAFADRYHVIAYDRRGFGETSYEAETFSHVRDLRAVMDELDIDRATLVGCSQGGRFSIDFALAHPDRVARLVLVAPAVGGAPDEQHYPPDIQKMIEAVEAAEDVRDFELVNRLEAHMWLDGPRSAEGRVQGPARDLFFAMNSIPLKSPSPGKFAPATDSWDRLGEIAAPTLLLWGDRDFPHLQERCKQMRTRIRNLKPEIMPGTAHLPNLEQPARFNQILREFLER